MARKFLSFLGTNPYLPCTYFRDGQEVADVRFIQEALARLHCQTWEAEDQIVVFLTRDAREKNWQDHGNTEKYPGLETRLKALHLSCRIRPVAIPDGKSEEEIWEIFSIVCNTIDTSDSVTLDITHALRSLPMLAMVVLQYMRVLRQVRLDGIHYGAFEVIGPIHQVKEMAIAERKAPIFDLTAFAQLADWAIATDRFLSAGNAGMIHDLVEKQAIPVIKNNINSARQEAIMLKKLAKQLLDFTEVMATCRGRAISSCAFALQQGLDNCKQADLIPPLGPLLDKMTERTAGFSGADEIKDGLRAARWCLEHNLIQQGYTILQETAVSYFMNLAVAPTSLKHLCDNKQREMVTGSAALLARKKGISEFRNSPEQDGEVLQKVWNLLKQKDNFQQMSMLEQRRNDLNHAGISLSPMNADSFGKELEKAIKWLEECVHEESPESAGEQ
jgi:CRISPR-associated Csx2 family protein